jgi:hypothetical protein
MPRKNDAERPFIVSGEGDSYDLVRDIGSGVPGIRCRTCKRVSYHPQDVANRYCGFCHKFHEEAA